MSEEQQPTATAAASKGAKGRAWSTEALGAKSRASSAEAPEGAKAGYKKTKLGWIPEDWQTLPLSRLVRSNRRIRYGIVQAGPNDPNGIPCLRVVDLAESRIQLEKLYRTSPEISARYHACILQANDIVFALRGEIGKVVLVDEELAGINITRGVARISPSERLDPTYLYYQLQSSAVHVLIDLQVNGTSLKEIPIAGLNRIDIPVPQSLPEQRRIAAILGTWDRAITTVQRLLAAQQKRKRGLMQELLSGIYHRVKKVDIGSVATEVTVRNVDNAEYPVLSCSKHVGFVSSLEYFKKQVYSDDRSNYKVIRKGQFGFPANHIEEGSIDLLRIHDIGVVSPIYVIFEFDGESVNSEFMRYLFKTERYRHIFSTSTNASVDRRGSLRWKDFQTIAVPLPHKQEQDRIANVFQRLDALIESQEALLTRLTAQKRGLMQQLLTGRVRVKVD